METNLIRKFSEATQHNILVRAPLKLNITEARIFALALGCIHKGDEELPHIRIRFEDVFPNSNGSGGDYEALNKACEGLMGKFVQLETVTGRSRIKELYSIISYIRLDSGTRLITGWFDERIAPYLLNLSSRFTTVEIETLLTLKSPHTHRVYWLLKSYMYQGMYEVDMVDFRKQILGEDHLLHYPQYYDFKRFILEPVMTEIQATGWNVTVEEIKPGKRKVIGLRFDIPDLEKQKPEPKKRKISLAKPPKQLALDMSGDSSLKIPAWLANYPKLNAALQYNRLQSQFNFPAGEAKAIIEALGNEEEFMKLTNAMYDILNPKSGVPPIGNAGAVLKSRLGIKK